MLLNRAFRRRPKEIGIARGAYTRGQLRRKDSYRERLSSYIDCRGRARARLICPVYYPMSLVARGSTFCRTADMLTHVGAPRP
jgi:hypothetical protein